MRIFLLALDRLGHCFSFSYRGSESHNTWLGTVLLSIGISVVLELIIFGVKLAELVYVTDSTRCEFYLEGIIAALNDF